MQRHSERWAAGSSLNRLGAVERIFDALAEAVTVTEADGRLLFDNAAALERMGLTSIEEAIAAGPQRLIDRFEFSDERGAPLRPQDLPGRRLLRGEPAPPMLLRTGRGEQHPTVPGELLAQRARDAEHLRILRELQMRSVMLAPLRARGRVIGAISFVVSELAGAYDEDDFAFAEEFAARAAVAVENARLYRERSETAEMLQRSRLPSRLPDVRGWRWPAATARPRPAG